MDQLGPNVPLHFSRFWPQHKLKNLPPTPISTLDKAWQIAQETGLHFAYVGNVPDIKETIPIAQMQKNINRKTRVRSIAIQYQWK